MDGRAMKMAQARRMAGRAMNRPSADMMGRAMVRPGMGGAPGMKKGGKADSKEMAKKEIAFMKKKGAPKSMIKHEKAEYGMKKGGSVGGSFRRAADGVASKGKTKGKQIKMNMGGKC